MADVSICPVLEPISVQRAYEKIKPYIHKTPLITSKSLDAIASHTNPAAFLSATPPSFTKPDINHDSGSPSPQFHLFFKCENQQKIGAFKARGAFHAITHLIEVLGLEALRKRGVTTHSSGNHAQALALAAHTFGVTSYIVMPTISTPSKIAGTRMYTENVIFSGSTSDEREAKVEEVIARTGAILVPPYDHPDIILGQGTAGLEMEAQFQEIKGQPDARFDAVLTPLGGGGLLGGTATWFQHTSAKSKSVSESVADSTPNHGKKTIVFGSEPSFSGANDAQIGLAQHPPTRIEHVKSLTIADGLRTPVGLIPWSIISDTSKVQGVYSASEAEIKMALRFMMERVKLFVEPSAVVPLAVVLFCQEFRQFVAERQAEEVRLQGGPVRAWDVGIILSGGNTTVEAVAKLFGSNDEADASSSVTNGEREIAAIGLDGSKKVEDVAG